MDIGSVWLFRPAAVCRRWPIRLGCAPMYACSLSRQPTTSLKSPRAARRACHGSCWRFVSAVSARARLAGASALESFSHTIDESCNAWPQFGSVEGFLVNEQRFIAILHRERIEIDQCTEVTWVDAGLDEQRSMSCFRSCVFGKRMPL